MPTRLMEVSGSGFAERDLRYRDKARAGCITLSSCSPRPPPRGGPSTVLAAGKTIHLKADRLGYKASSA